MRRLRVYRRVVTDVVRFRTGRRTGPLVYVDLRSPLFNKRYTYLFLKFLLMEGCSVALRYRPDLVLRFNELKYTHLIFAEDDLFVLPFGVAEPTLSICDRRGCDRYIHLDYFGDEGRASRYAIPMAMHPLFYCKGSWNRSVSTDRRARSVVFSGNLERERYGDPEALDAFDVPSRVEQLEEVRREGRSPVRARLDGEIDDGIVYLLDRSSLGIGIDGWREFLARFRFFLALPGQVMPLCHNVVEAMSVGTVPVIHESYARLFSPPLRDMEEVMTYAEGGLAGTLEAALALSEDDAARMSEGTRSYYGEHLVPRAVVRRIMSDEVSELALCGEGDSVELMKAAARAP